MDGRGGPFKNLLCDGSHVGRQRRRNSNVFAGPASNNNIRPYKALIKLPVIADCLSSLLYAVCHAISDVLNLDSMPFCFWWKELGTSR